MVRLFMLILGISLYGQHIEVQRFQSESSSSLGAYWVEREIPKTLSPYLWLDSSKDFYFEDTSGNLISCNSTTSHSVKKWLDRSGNDRHFQSVSNSANPTYYCDSQTDPYYLSDAKVSGDGIDDDMRFDFGSAPAGTLDGLSGVIDQDFTFVFVLQAIDPSPSNYDSFIASGNSSLVAKNWQISTTDDINNFYFALRGNTKANTKTKVLVPFDTNTHVFVLQRYTVGSTIRIKFSVDGNLAFDEATNAASAPTLSVMKLYKNRNRNNETYKEANFKELFVFNKELTADEEYELEQYLLSKWGS